MPLQGLRKYLAKIGESNTASQKLFQQLKFKEVSRSTVFREITYELHVREIQDDLSAIGSRIITAEYDI